MVDWELAIDSIPSQCSRNHETVDMVNYARKSVDPNYQSQTVELKYFCPSCHQKLKYTAKKIGSRFVVTGYEILEDGNIKTIRWSP